MFVCIFFFSWWCVNVEFFKHHFSVPYIYMFPFLRKNHHVTIPYLQQLPIQDDTSKKHLCVLPLTPTAHRQWGKPSASLSHSGFSLSQLQGGAFCHNQPAAAGAGCTEREVNHMPPLIYANSKDQDAHL